MIHNVTVRVTETFGSMQRGQVVSMALADSDGDVRVYSDPRYPESWFYAPARCLELVTPPTRVLAFSLGPGLSAFRSDVAAKLRRLAEAVEA